MKSSSHNATKSRFKLKGDHGRIAIQATMEAIGDVSELSVVRGFFQILTEDLAQLTSSIQGVYFQKYGKLVLITSNDRLYLKGTRAVQRNETTRRLTNEVLSSIVRRDPSLSHSVRQHRRLLAAALAAEPQEARGDPSLGKFEGPGLAILQGHPTSPDPLSFIFPIPASEDMQSDSGCNFVLNLKVGPACDPGSGPCKLPTEWVLFCSLPFF